MKTTWTTRDMPRQDGRTAVVTGATGGLGWETARALAAAGARVVLAGRSPAKGEVAVARLRTAVPGADVRFELLDLASLASIGEFAARLADAGAPVDVLVNNAGVMALPDRRTTEDGFEMQLGTNHLAHFALTARLLPLLRAAAAPRVVTVSSIAAKGGALRFDDLQGERRYVPWAAYQQSKLANLLFAFELQRRSDAAGWGLRSVAVHPGVAPTELIPNGPGARSLQGRLAVLMGPLFSHPVADAALPSLYAATAPDAAPGGYYGPQGMGEVKGPVGPAKVAPAARDAGAAARLWDVSERLTGVRWPAPAEAAA